jgi:murein DD-endopeptidase MepM/ murein hydrolase activator NlpD
MRVLIVLLLALAGASVAAPASAQSFVLPLDCAVGETCVVQNYVDRDAGAGATDPMCGPLTYNGHDGLDFRAPSALARRGVRVLAPAAGIVAAVRDGEADGAFQASGAGAVEGRDCGNGLRINHEGGWSSQLCHMRAGSLRVRQGDRVTAGQDLGLIGLSGRTEFPHVHLTLRRNDEKIDPITGGALTGACNVAAATPGAHWSSAARQALGYRGALVFAAGFTGEQPAQGANPENGATSASARAPVLLFWALASGPRSGDVLRVRLYGPDGALVAEGTRTQPRDQAQAWTFAGRRTPPAGWPAGTYRGEARLERAGRVISTRSETLALR